MLSRLRIYILTILIVAGLASAGCVSTNLPEGADYSHRYYAALADYNLTKRAVLAYAQIPETPLSHIDAILTTVNRTDQRIRQFEALRKVDPSLVSAEDYDLVLKLIDLAAEQLRSYVVRRSS